MVTEPGRPEFVVVICHVPVLALCAARTTITVKTTSDPEPAETGDDGKSALTD